MAEGIACKTTVKLCEDATGRGGVDGNRNRWQRAVVDNLKELFSKTIKGIKLVREEKISRFIK